MLHNVVFAPSLLGAKQDATLALHECWCRQASAAQRSDGGAPPPPLMVMAGAMLRRPALDQVREFNASVPAENLVLHLEDPSAHEDSQQRDQNLYRRLNQSLAANDAEAVAETRFGTLSSTNRLQPNWRRIRMFRYFVRTIDSLACAAAAAHLNLEAFVAALHSLHRHYPNEGRTMDGALTLYDLQWDVTLPAIFTEARQCVFENISRIDTKRIESILARHKDETRQRQSALPMGDVRCLLLALRTATVSSRHLSALLDFTAHGDSSCGIAAVIAALAELDRVDIAAMLFATAGELTRDVWLTEVQRDVRNLEMRMIVTTHSPPDDYSTRARMPSVMAAFDAKGDAVVRVASPHSLDHCHVLLAKDAALLHGRVVGAAAHADRALFLQRWKEQLRGLLDGWDWSHCLAAGGAVVRALLGASDDASTSFDGDVDLFFHGLGFRALRARIQALERHVRRTVGAGHYAVLLTRKTATIVVEGGPRLQVALGKWSSVSDVLSTCDVDCCGVGFDGTEVVMTGRAAAAYASGVNVASASRHMVRGSIVYEMRLWKYARRYGFAVVDPLYWDDDEAVVSTRASLAAEFGGVGKAHTKAARRAATSLTGLRWLMAVDAGYVTPKEVKSDLVVGNTTTLAKVLAKVTEKGYMESDNYGTHEEGYVVVQEGDGAEIPPNRDSAAEDPNDDWGYFDCTVPLYNHCFSGALEIHDFDCFEEEAYEMQTWRLDP